MASGEKIIDRSYAIQNTFDKVTYSIGETVNAIVNISNTGNFQEDLSLKVEVPEFQYSRNSSISASPQQTVTESYSIPVPLDATSGKHSLLVTLGNGSVAKNFDFYIPESKLELSTLSGSCNAGESISVTVNNTGGGGTNYELSTTLRDMNGFTISNNNFTGSISAKDTKVHHLTVPSGSVSGQYILKLSIKDQITGRVTDHDSNVSVSGISGTLAIRTGKDVYLDTEGIGAIMEMASTGESILNAELSIKVLPAAKTGTVRGTVIDAVSGESIQGARISIGDKETYTTSQGEFVLVNISSGLHTINIVYPGFDKGTAEINVPEGVLTYNAVLSPSKYGTLKSTIKDAATEHLIIGAKLEIVPREVLSSDAESRISFSNFDGIAELKLPAGSYTLRIIKDGYYPLDEPEISVVEGMNEKQFSVNKTNIQPQTTGELSGRVMNRLTNEVLLGVEVKIDNTFSNRVLMNEQTYHFYDIPPGLHTLSVNYAGYDKFETTAEIVAGQQSYDIFLTPSHYGNLSGTVKDASTGNIISGAQVELTPLEVASSDQSSIVVYSGFTGLYTLNKFPVGTYAVKVTKQYYSELNTMVTFQEVRTTLDIDLQQAEPISRRQ